MKKTIIIALLLIAAFNLRAQYNDVTLLTCYAVPEGTGYRYIGSTMTELYAKMSKDNSIRQSETKLMRIDTLNTVLFYNYSDSTFSAFASINGGMVKYYTEIYYAETGSPFMTITEEFVKNKPVKRVEFFRQ